MTQLEKTEQLLATITAQLTRQGYAFSQTAKDTLRLALPRPDGVPYAFLHIATLDALLPGATHLKDDACAPLWDYHEEDLLPDAQTGTDTYLLLVGADDFVCQPAFATLLEGLPLDSHIAKKQVCGLSELMTWVGNPFAAWASPAATPPIIHVIKGSRQAWEAPLPENKATLRFSLPHRDSAEALRPTQSRQAEAKALAEVLFRRILGAAFQLCWDEAESDMPCVSRRCSEGDPWLTPWYCAGSGEQLALALSLFLANAYVDAQPDTYLYLPDILGRFDAIRRLGALDCLRDFVLATGASVYLEANNENIRHFASRKLGKLAAPTSS